MAKSNYTKQQKPSVYSPIRKENLTDTTVSQMDFTDWQTYQQSSNNGYDKRLEFKHPACLDDIISVTKETVEKHETEVKETMKNLEEAGYGLHPKKCDFFKREAEWVQHQLDQNGSDNKYLNMKKKREGVNIFPGSDPMPIKVYRESFSTNSYTQKTTQKTKPMDLETRTYRGVQQSEKKTKNAATLLSTLQPKQ